jgi:hypothetical protein
MWLKRGPYGSNKEAGNTSRPAAEALTLEPCANVRVAPTVPCISNGSIKLIGPESCVLVACSHALVFPRCLMRFFPPGTLDIERRGEYGGQSLCRDADGKYYGDHHGWPVGSWRGFSHGPRPYRDYPSIGG